MQTAILVESGPSMCLGSPSKRLRAVRAALASLRAQGAAGAWAPSQGLRWVPIEALGATLASARHVDLVATARDIARLPVDRVVVLGDLYEPDRVVDAMRRVRGCERLFVEILTDAERGLSPAPPEERAMVAYLETLRPYRERALTELRRDGVRLGEGRLRAA